MTSKNYFFFIKKAIKNIEFQADFKFEKVVKKFTKKVISKNVTEICTFSTFTHVRQTCFAYNFILVLFKNGFKIRMKFCVF